jgi:hypothetical protein
LSLGEELIAILHHLRIRGDGNTNKTNRLKFATNSLSIITVIIRNNKANKPTQYRKFQRVVTISIHTYLVCSHNKVKIVLPQKRLHHIAAKRE